MELDSLAIGGGVFAGGGDGVDVFGSRKFGIDSKEFLGEELGEIGGESFADPAFLRGRRWFCSGVGGHEVVEVG